jgi:FtsP/CotA-like multicopper oxidase with cupredoxin domain
VGTEVRATVQNTLPVPITVHGLDTARGAAGPGTTIAPGARAGFRFRAAAPGVSYYVAYVGPRRPAVLRFHDDTQLHGAVVVDPAAPAAATPAAATPAAATPGRRPPRDRVFVISGGSRATPPPSAASGRTRVLAVNGRSWPFTERLTVPEGDTARWHVVNATLLEHPMHLHGAHFRVDARGDGARDTVYSPAERRLAVTELMMPGHTASVAWTPVHPGNWVFHCHFASHITVREAFEADRRMPARPAAVLTGASGAGGHGAHGAHPAGVPHRPGPDGAPRHMEGLVMGITVPARGAAPAAHGPSARSVSSPGREPASTATTWATATCSADRRPRRWPTRSRCPVRCWSWCAASAWR